MKKILMFLLIPLFFINLFSVPKQSTDSEDQLILVSLKTKTLQFFENGKLIHEFSVRIGKSLTPTPIGEGYIYEKRKKPIFRYVDPGPNQGQIIKLAECGDGFKEVDYLKMRSLAIKINGMRRYSIHSTTCSETMGQAISNGCIGMNIPDMLTLYPRVHTQIKIKIVE